MSVKVHEAFSLDSFQDRLLWFDDFHGDQLQDEWRAAGVAGSATVIDAQTGGICRIITGATTNDNYYIDWNTIRSLLVSKKVTLEYRLKLSSVTNIGVYIDLYFDGNNRIGFRFDTGVPDTNWMIRCYNAAAGGFVDTGVAPDTSEHIFRIECFPTDEVHFYIDGVECGNSPITTNITANYLQPRFFIQTRADATKSMDVDYVYIRQER